MNGTHTVVMAWVVHWLRIASTRRRSCTAGIVKCTICQPTSFHLSPTYQRVTMRGVLPSLASCLG